MDFSRLKAINDQKAQEAKEAQNKTEAKLANLDLQETVVKSIATLVDYLDGNVSKSYVVNQLKEISTPDVEKVVKAVESLHTTLKTHENTDITPLTEVMKRVLEETEKIPKAYQEKKEIDYSEVLDKLANQLKAVEQAVKEQELKVEAPIVNVPQQKITVPKPEVKIVKETTEVTNEITVTDWRKEYVFSDSRKTETVSYYGYLKTDGSWYIMRHRKSEDEDEDELSDDWDEIRYVFGKDDYKSAFNKREKLSYKYLSEARDE